jgi:hypothetical protein
VFAYDSSSTVLPPTSEEIFRDDGRPYFLWWTDLTTAEFRELLKSDDPETRAYWTAALLREANSRDVWPFISPREIKAQWTRLIRYLGKSRAMWAWLLDLEDPGWPPKEARVD